MGFVLAYCIIVTAPVPWFEGLGIGDRACQFVKDHERRYLFPSNKVFYCESRVVNVGMGSF